MSETTSQDTDRLIAGLDRLQQTLGGMTNGLRDRDQAEKVLSRDLRKRTEAAAGALGSLTKDASSAGQYIKSAIGGTLLGAAFAKLVSVGQEMTSHYRDMVSVGQNFEGSILNMSIMAGRAGLPLAEFAESIKQSSKVVSRMGMKDFVSLRKSINQSMVQHGMYAMTTEQVTANMAGYLETNRRMGMVERMTHQQVGSSFVRLMGHTTALSGATGVARDEIQKMAQAAIVSSMAMSRMALMSQSTAQRANQNFQESMAVLAAHGPEAAQFLTGLHAEAFGQASAAFTDQGRALISVGLGHLGTMFENEMTAEQTIEAQQRFRQEIEANIPLLRNLAKGTGESATNARKLLEIQSDMQEMTAEDYRRARRNAESQDGITKLFTSLGTAWNLIIGDFKAGFAEGFKPLFASVGDFTTSNGFKNIQEGFKTLGERLGSLVKWVLSPAVLENIGKGLNAIGGFLYDLPWKDISIGVAAFATAVIAGSTVKWGALFGVLGVFTSMLTGLTEAIGPEAVAAIGVGMVGLGAISKAFGVFSSLRNMFSRSMTVNAANVIVNGGGGMGGGGGGGGGGRNRRRGSLRGRTSGSLRRLRRMGRGGRLAGAVGMGGRALRGLGRGFLPLSLLMGGAEIAAAPDGASRRRAVGGMAGGAGGALAGAAAGAALGSVVPILGTAVGGLIGGVLGGMGGDMLGRSVVNGIASPRANTASGGRRWGRMAMMAGGVGAVGAIGYGAYNALSGSEEAPRTSERDPVVTKLDEVVRSNKEIRDAVMASQQAVVNINNQQLSALRDMKNVSPNS